MFTSKKALYLNKDFDRISPITNIDSLYYELAEVSSGKYVITRKSVAKHMPIKFIYNNKETSIGVINTSNFYNIKSGSYIPDVDLNIDFDKTELENPKNYLNNNRPVYDTNLYQINSSIKLNLLDVLQYYTPINYFDSSIQNVSIYIDQTINNYNNLNTSFNNASSAITDFFNNIYINDITTVLPQNPSNNKIYDLLYYPNNYYQGQYTNASFFVKVQGVNITDANIKNYVSLDVAKAKGNDKSIEKWEIHYNVNTSTLTYLKDEYGNEGNFDFRNRYVAQNNLLVFNISYTSGIFLNNKLFFNPTDAGIIFDGKNINNEVYNSSFLYFSNSSNNIVYNSHGAYIKGKFNKIYNSSNYKSSGISTDASLYIQGNNNIIINCNDCSIKISGNNNILINLENQNLNLNNNNIIVDDLAGSPNNSIQLSNNKLFLNQSSSTAITYNLTNNCTLFGGVGNDILIYVNEIRTTNK